MWSIKSIYPGNQNEGSGYSCIIHDKRLYIATTSGLYSAQLNASENQDLSFQKSDFTLVHNARGQVWNISAVNDQLLMGHHEGAYLIKNNSAIPLNKSSGFWTFIPLSSIQPSYIMVAGSYRGIQLYKYKNGTFENILDLPFESARYITIDDGNIWVSHPYKGVFKVAISADNIPKVTLYAEKHGLSTQNNYVFKIKIRLVAATDHGIYSIIVIPTDLKYLHF